MPPHKRLDLLDIAEKLPDSTMRSRYVSGLCPFHDDHRPSLLAFPDGFVCLSCRKRGSLETLWNKINRGRASRPAPPPEAGFPWRAFPDLDDLAERAHEMLLDHPEKMEYLKRRGVGDRIEPNRIGWLNGWYTVPLVLRTGEVRAVIARADSIKAKMRYQHSPGYSALFVPDWPTFRRAQRALVVFGVFDALSLAALGFPVCSPPLGKRVEPAWLLCHRKQFIIVPDRNEERDAFLLAAKLGWRARALRLNYPVDCKDPNDYIQSGKTAKLTIELSKVFE